MTINVSFRVVGLYCFFENLEIPGLTEDSTVKEVMDAIAGMQTDFSYQSAMVNNKEIVDTISYTFSNDSQVPFNASTPIAQGFRDLENQIGKLGTVWQYYRSATGSIDGGSPFEVKLLSRGQPSFAALPLNYNDPSLGSSLPDGFEVGAWNLTWRLVQIQMSPERQAQFMQGKAESLRKRV